MSRDEKKFALDEEMKFKARARRNKLFGTWAAEKLGKIGQDAEGYSNEVVRSDFEEVGDEDVFRKVRADFEAAGIAHTEGEIRIMMEKTMIAALASIGAKVI